MSSENSLLPRVWELERSLASAVRVNEALRQQLVSLKNELKDIGKAIDDPRTDLTMTMSEIIVEQKKQLAAALAAVKVKDAALQSAISAHGYESGDLHDALAIQPDDSALKAWLGEPVAHMREWEGDVSDLGSMIFASCADEMDDSPNWIPLYAPKGMTK